MDEPLDETYFKWLCSNVEDPRARYKRKRHWGLLRRLYTTEFVWTVPNDDNRIYDGVALRDVFLQETERETISEDWMSLGCSFLEMLIALSRHLSFAADGEVATWFWQMIRNIDLDGIDDAVFENYPAEDISEKLDIVLWRRYTHNGEGGLFPLREPDADQRTVEIWYQMNAYLIENC